MTMKIGDEGSLPSLTTEQIEGKAAVAKGDASAEGVVIDAAEPGSAQGAGGALGFTETMPVPDHSAVERTVDAARQYAGVKRTIKHDIHKAERDVSRDLDDVEGKIDRKVRRAERQVRDAVWEAEYEIEDDVRGAESAIDRKARRAERQIKDKMWETEHAVKKVIHDKAQGIEEKVENELSPLTHKIAIARDIVHGTGDVAHLGREAYDLKQLQQVAQAFSSAYAYAEDHGETSINIRISDTGEAYADDNTVYITPGQAAMLRKDGIDVSSEMSTDDVPSLVSSIGSVIGSTKLGALGEDAYVAEQLGEAARLINEYAEAGYEVMGNDYKLSFKISSTGSDYEKDSTIYLTPEQYVMLQNHGVDITPGSSMHADDAMTAAAEAGEAAASELSGLSRPDLLSKLDPRTVAHSVAIADRLMDHWKAYEAKHGILPADDMNSDQASGSTPGDTTSDQVDDAVLSFGSMSVSAFAKEGSVGDWPGAVAVARAGADKLEDAFSTAQQEVVSDLTSKASVGEEGSVDVPQSTV